MADSLPSREEIAEILKQSFPWEPRKCGEAADALLARLRPAWGTQHLDELRDGTIHVCINAMHGDSSDCGRCVVCQRDALRADLEREKETHRLDIALVLKLERQVNASVPKEVYAAQAETVTQLRGELIAAQGSINEKLQIIGLQRAALAVWKEAYPGDANPGMTATALRADLHACAEALEHEVAMLDSFVDNQAFELASRTLIHGVANRLRAIFAGLGKVG